MAYARGTGESAEAHAERLVQLLEQKDEELRGLRRQLALEPEPPSEAPSGPEEAGEAGSGGGGGLAEAEAMLAGRSQASQSPAVLQLLQGLQAAAVYTDAPNHDTNRKLWDAYAKGWAPNEDWVKRMAGHLPGDPRALSCVGDEWSDEPSLAAVLEDWLLPLLDPSARAAEVGSGGGRIAARAAGHVRELVCFDVSAEMLAAAKKHLGERGFGNVRFQQIPGEGDYPAEYSSSFDIVYSFDVFVHMDLHQMRRTLRCIREVLRPGGRCFISFANLLAPDGWHRFARQKSYTVGGFYFVSPDIVRCLLRRAGLRICRMSTPQVGNTYLNRDLLVLAERPAEESGAPAG